MMNIQKVTDMLTEFYSEQRLCSAFTQEDAGAEAVAFEGIFVHWVGEPVDVAEFLSREGEFDTLVAEREEVAKWRSFRDIRTKYFEAARWALDAVMNDAPGMSAEDKTAWGIWQAWWMCATSDYTTPAEALASQPTPPSPLYID